MCSRCCMLAFGGILLGGALLIGRRRIGVR